MCVCVCVFVLHTSLFPSRGGRMRALNSECKINQADFTDNMSFPSSNLMEEISPDPEALNKNT